MNGIWPFHSRYFDLSRQEKHRCYINNGLLDSSVPVSHDSVTVSMHYTRTLKLKEPKGIWPSFIYDLHLCVILSKCVQWKDSSSLTMKQSINFPVCSVFILFSITLTAILNMDWLICMDLQSCCSSAYHANCDKKYQRTLAMLSTSIACGSCGRCLLAKSCSLWVFLAKSVCK